LKYVSIESLPGSLLTLISLIFTKSPPQLLGGYGVWGITTFLIENLGLAFFNYFWLIPITWFYVFLIKQKSFLKKLYPSVFFFLTLLFLVFSKNLHPQYIFWFITFFPLLQFKSKAKKTYLIMYFLLLTMAYLNQNVYPLLYTGFIKNFYQQGQQVEIFYLQLLRNLSIVALLILSFKSTFIKKTIQ